MLKKLYMLIFIGMFSNQVHASVIDFDDRGNGYLPSDYAGLDWGTMKFGVVTDTPFQSTHGNSYGSPSGESALYNSNGVDQSVEFGSTVDFQGAFFSAWANGDDYGSYGATSITINGFLAGSLVGSKTMSLSATKYDWFDVNLFGVDKLEFVTSGFEKWWVMDDFTYDAATASVPEPNSGLILFAGVFALLLSRKKLTSALSVTDRLRA
ncbi:PEP-CTERM sorting domain-containing protein [Simiduia aestuariiviva]|uniref:PEP-CTERM protein-sorting domain-containing protein n=1 Tax=Simiduia aestuariiviva TaxID=1510459 RepID=A0A839UFZ7_9GAMM|nr:PEP-CTERM sorting domain-containing protein [Simiduia aestuariiviva]MBB3166964.1 hypothetical protein [Simiduia aestuariiviva]